MNSSEAQTLIDISNMTIPACQARLILIAGLGLYKTEDLANSKLSHLKSDDYKAIDYWTYIATGERVEESLISDIRDRIEDIRSLLVEFEDRLEDEDETTSHLRQMVDALSSAEDNINSAL